MSDVNISRVPLLVPDMPSVEALLPFLEEIDRNRWYTNFGPLVRRFESSIAEKFRLGPHVVTTNSGTAALELSLAALRLPKGSLVLAPAFTFVATITAIMRAGLTPVLADVDPGSWLLTPPIARQVIEHMPIAVIMPVATFGCPHDAKSWDKFSEETGIPVIIDAAGALGNQEICQRAIVTFSLHATKALGVGEGGVVAASDGEFVGRVRELTNFGIDVTSGLVSDFGSNAKMSEYHAAVGLAALQSWSERQIVRVRTWQQYASILAAACPELLFQRRPEDGTYTIAAVGLPPRSDPSKIAEVLNANRIESRRWYYPPIFEHNAFKRLPRASTLEVARRLSGRIIGVPFYPQMKETEQRLVATCLAKALYSA